MSCKDMTSNYAGCNGKIKESNTLRRNNHIKITMSKCVLFIFLFPKFQNRIVLYLYYNFVRCIQVYNYICNYLFRLNNWRYSLHCRDCFGTRQYLKVNNKCLTVLDNITSRDIKMNFNE
jgi:hypothetical protein